MLTGSLPEMACEEGGIIRETLTREGEGGCIGRGLFDKQTCYPIRRWRRVWEEEPRASPISCCYEANGLD